MADGVYRGKERDAILSGMRSRYRLGDKVEAVTRAIGIKPCGSCKKRKDWLNGVKNENVDADSKK